MQESFSERLSLCTLHHGLNVAGLLQMCCGCAADVLQMCCRAQVPGVGIAGMPHTHPSVCVRARVRACVHVWAAAPTLFMRLQRRLVCSACGAH
eukprot:129893-Chlamydomonas_euryale.AAC.1